MGSRAAWGSRSWTEPQLKSTATASERTVAGTVEPGRVVGHHLFWLTKTTPAGVIDEDADDAEDTAAPDKSA